MSLNVKDSFKEWKKDPEFRAEYKKLGPEFETAAALLKCRKKAKLTQQEVADRMDASRRLVARIESGEANVTVASIRKYVEACGKRLKIGVV
ncbi:MAG: transcriptional regulator [Rickettsiales bacterium]|nr:transcriptional regulator [Rickettsiales bacterium]